MNRFVRTALAIAVAGSAAQAGTGDNEWAALDSEISGLASSLQPSQDGNGWSVLLRAGYSHSSDDLFAGVNMSDLSGFYFNDVDLAFWGTQGSYSWRVSADIDGNSLPVTSPTETLALEDAYIRWACGTYFDAMFGNFKPRVTRSNSVDPEGLLFIDRSAIGSAFDTWDEGIGASGGFEQLRWFAAVMNGLGSDGGGHTSDHFYLLRGEWDFGSGAGKLEGAMGSTDTLNGTVGLSFINDDTTMTSGGDSDTYAFLVDFHGSVSQVGFGAEIADIGEDYVGWATDEDFSNIFAAPLALADDSQPWNVYASYLINPEWEVGVRYEDLDNDEVAGASGADNTLLSVVLNYYGANNAGKWQVQYTDVEADSGFPDGSLIEVGYTVGLTR